MTFGRTFGTALGALIATATAAFAGDTLIGVRDDGALVTFDSTSPSTFASVVAVTGLAGNEFVVGTCVRPTDGALFAVGSTSRVYQIQSETGFAAAVGGFLFNPPLDGSDFGVAFDPGGAVLRVTSDKGQNLALDPSNGQTTAVNTTLTYAAGDVNAGFFAGVVACAWTNSQQTGSKMYGIDLARAALVSIDSPAAGTVRTIGPLGTGPLVTGGYTGLDVSAATGTAYATLATQGSSVSRLYSINLATGAATPIGSAMTALLRGASVVPTSTPAPVGTQLVALVPPNMLYTVTTDKPNRLQRTVRVKGLPTGDSFVGVAVRPKNGVLYGITRTAVYDVDQATQTAQIVGNGFDQPLPIGPLACDFDPATDALRVVGGLGANLRVSADTGEIVDAVPITPDVDGDAPFQFATGDPRQGSTPTVGTIAFTGREQPFGPSKCYVLETNNALLALLGDPADAPGESRDGKLYSVGLLGIDGVPTLPPGRALVATSKRTGYVALQNGPLTSVLHRVDLSNGRTFLVGAVAAPGVVSALTVSPTTNPPRVTVKTMRIVLNFRKQGLDSLVLVGSTPTVGSLDGRTLKVDVGGVSREFVLDDKGRGKIGRYDSTRVAGASAHGLLWRMTLKRTDIAALLADEQMTGLVQTRREPRQVLVTVTLEGKAYRTLVDLAYTARPGRSAVAVTN